MKPSKIKFSTSIFKFAKCSQRMSQKRPFISRLNFFARGILYRNEKQPSIQVPVMNSSGSSVKIFFLSTCEGSRAGRQPLSGLTPWMVLVLTPVDDPRTGATKTPVENPPTPTDRRVSQIRFICRIVRGLNETWDPLDEEERRSSERWDRNRRILKERWSSPTSASRSRTGI